MPSFFKKRIMKQFRLVLCCLLIMGIVLSLLCYSDRAADDQKFNRVCPEYRTKV